MLKPFQDEQKILDDAVAEVRTAPRSIAPQGSRSHKRNREQGPLMALPEAPPEFPEALSDESEDDFTSSDSHSTDKGSDGMGSSTSEED